MTVADPVAGGVPGHEAGRDASIATLLERNARYYGSHPAYVLEGESITHAELLARAQRIGSAWFKLGLRRGDRVAILAKNCLEYAEVYAAGELGGFIVTTVNFRLTAPEIDYVLGDSAPALLIFQENYAQVVDAVRSGIPTLRHCIGIGEAPDWALGYQDVAASGDPAGPPFRGRAADDAHLIYTSGTTGRPKGCILGQLGHFREAQFLAQDLGLHQGDRALLSMPLFHIGAKAVQFAVHLVGGTCVLTRDFEPAQYLALVYTHRITVGHLAPTMIQMLLESPGLAETDTTSLRVVLYSAAAMPLPILRRAIAAFGRVFQNQYGMTEAPGTALSRFDHDPDGDPAALRRLQSAGRPFPGVSLRIETEAGQECPPGKAGEICLWSEGLFKGYWNNPAATAEAMRGGWFHTGDIGLVDADGCLYIVDRKKDMIVSGGENVYSREVENVLLDHPGILDAAVIAAPSSRWGEAVRAVIVTRPGTALTASDVVAHCRTQLAGYKCPKSVEFIGDLPKLPSGKINKLLLRRTFDRLLEDEDAGPSRATLSA